MLQKILVIDEDPQEAHLLKDALLEVNPALVVYHADSRRHAFRRLNKSKSRQPHIILLGMKTPLAETWLLLDEIKHKETARAIPVIVYSASSDKQDIEQAIRLGAFGFLVKPRGYAQLKISLGMITDAFNRPLPVLPPQQETLW